MAGSKKDKRIKQKEFPKGKSIVQGGKPQSVLFAESSLDICKFWSGYVGFFKRTCWWSDLDGNNTKIESVGDTNLEWDIG